MEQPTQWAAPVEQWRPRGPAPGLLYAGFWRRFLAYLVDFVVLVAGMGALQQTRDIGFHLYTGGSAFVDGRYYASYYGIHLSSVVPVLIAGAYFVVTWALLRGSPGLRLLGMRIRRTDTGGRPGPGRAVVRYVGLLLAALPLGLGLMWAGWDARKQGWHDKLASTVVVRDDYS